MGKKARLNKLRETVSGNMESMRATAPIMLDEATQKTISTALLSALLILGIVLRVVNIDVRGRSPDEKVYAHQAMTVVQDGVGGIKKLISEHGANKKAWIYPPPTRIGYIFLLAGTMKVVRVFDERAGTYLSTLCSIGALFILTLMGLRFFNRWTTAAALLLIAVSPMDLAIARRSWQDSMLAFFGLLLVWFCCELTEDSKRVQWYIPFVLAGSYCLVIKESGIVIYGLCVIWLLAIAIFREKSISKGAVLILFMLFSVIVSIAISGYVSGGISSFFEVLRHWKGAMPENVYAIKYQSGPWYHFLEGLWLLTPAGVLLAVAGIAGALFDRPAANDAVKGIVFFTISFLSIMILTPYSQNIRYISVLYVPFYLMCGAGAWYVFSLMKRLLRGRMSAITAAAMVCALIAVSVYDYKTFDKIFVRRGAPDMSVRLLREASNLPERVQ